MRLEKNGFVLHLEGTWLEISNKYGVLEHGDVAANIEDIPEGFAENKLDDFIRQHSICEKSNPTYIKKVAFDVKGKEYIQLQAILPVNGDYWLIQKYDNELVYMGEEWSGCEQTFTLRAVSRLGCTGITDWGIAPTMEFLHM